MPDTPHACARRIVDLALGETADAEHRCRPEDRVTVAHEVLVRNVANAIEAEELACYERAAEAINEALGNAGVNHPRRAWYDYCYALAQSEIAKEFGRAEAAERFAGFAREKHGLFEAMVKNLKEAAVLEEREKAKPLREALRPFAEQAELMDDEDWADCVNLGVALPTSTELLAGHLRVARAALQEQPR